MRGAALLLLAAAGCAGVVRDPGGASFRRAEVADLFFRWREGERRRDADRAQAALHFESRADRAFHRDELAALEGAPAGPIRTARELPLVGHPEPLGPGEYLFLEPAGRAWAATAVTVVAVGGRPRILYRRPLVGVREQRALAPAAAARLAVERRIAAWEALAGEGLAAEAARTRTLLRRQAGAEEYARARGLALPPFAPAPGTVLASLEGRDPEETRAFVVAALREALERGG